MAKKTKKALTITIHVYMADGRVFTYDISGTDAEELAGKGREHAHAIVSKGYRHNAGTGTFEYYGPHLIEKVKLTGVPVPTRFPDRVTGT